MLEAKAFFLQIFNSAAEAELTFDDIFPEPSKVPATTEATVALQSSAFSLKGGSPLLPPSDSPPASISAQQSDSLLSNRSFCVPRFPAINHFTSVAFARPIGQTA